MSTTSSPVIRPTELMIQRPPSVDRGSQPLFTVNISPWPATAGTPLIDYFIGDPVSTPFSLQPHFDEKIVHLPDSYQVNDRQRPIADAPSREALGLPADSVVLCNFNATWKLKPDVFDAWATILRRVPATILWLLARRDGDPAVANLRREIGVMR